MAKNDEITPEEAMKEIIENEREIQDGEFEVVNLGLDELPEDEAREILNGEEEEE